MTPSFIYNRWVCALKQNKDTIERQRILAIVRNPATNLYLIVQYTSNNEISFVAWWIEEWDDAETTIHKELAEESWLTDLQSIAPKPERSFTVSFYSPHRDKNYCNHTAVYLVETIQETIQISKEEQKIQSPHRWTHEQIQQKINEWRDNTNYESLQYLLDKLR